MNSKSFPAVATRLSSQEHLSIKSVNSMPWLLIKSFQDGYFSLCNIFEFFYESLSVHSVGLLGQQSSQVIVLIVLLKHFRRSLEGASMGPSQVFLYRY